MEHIFVFIILLCVIQCALNCELCNIDSKEDKEVYREEKLKDQILMDNGFQIFVQTLTGKTVALEAKLTDSVESLKKQIWDKEGIPIGQQRLIYSGRQLEDGHALAEYDIPNGTTLQLILSLRTGRRIKIFVDLQKKFTIFANESDTIEKLKDEILRYLHDLEMKTFVFDKLQNDAIGHLSSDDNTIADYGIRNLATLHVRDQPQTPPILSPKFITRHHFVHRLNRNRGEEVQNAVTVVRDEQINKPLSEQKTILEGAESFAGKSQNVRMQEKAGSSRNDAQNALILGDQIKMPVIVQTDRADLFTGKDQNGLMQKSGAGLSRKDAQITTILGDITNMPLLTEQKASLIRSELSAEKDQNVSAPKSSAESSPKDAQNTEILLREAQTNLPLPLTGPKASLDNAKSFSAKDENGLLQKTSSGLSRKDAQIATILGDQPKVAVKGQTKGAEKGAKNNQNGQAKKVANMGIKKIANNEPLRKKNGGKSQMGKNGTGVRKPMNKGAKRS